MLARLEDGPLDGSEMEVPDLLPLISVIIHDWDEADLLHPPSPLPLAVYKLSWETDHYVYRFWRYDIP
jgi:hypothetical protein